MIQYDILASGSKGNCTIIQNEIMLDCGVPYKTLRPYIKTLRLILLTHQHADHFNTATISLLARERPSLRFLCGTWLAADLRNLGVLKRRMDQMQPSESAAYSEFASGCKITMVPAVHNVPNAGYKIYLPNGKKVFYMTDTNEINHISAKDFDLYLLEANYSEEEIRWRIDTKTAAGKYAYEINVLKSHLSREKADEWLRNNMGPRSTYVYIHQHED